MARQPTTELPLAEGAMLIAAEEYRDLDIARYLVVLDALADDARGALRPGMDALGLPNLDHPGVEFQ